MRRLLVTFGLAAMVALPLGAQIEEEDLPLGAEWELRWEEARSVFDSSDQPRSIPLLSELAEDLEARWAAGELDDEGRRVMVKCLALRAEAAFNLGDLTRAETDLDRVVVLDPTFSPDRSLVSPKFWGLFERIRSRHVGDLELRLDPPDARVALDGAPLPPFAVSVPVLAGRYRLTAERPGFDGREEDVAIQAGKRTPIAINLPRSGAALTVVTRPVGVTVRIDGEARATTGGSVPPDLLLTGEAARYPRGEFSDLLLVGMLAPGSHGIVLEREGYRDESFDLFVAEPRDYDLGVVVLDRSRGTLRFPGLPDEATVLLDGVASFLDRRRSGAPSLAVAPGAHRIEVEHGAEGVFQTEVTVGDGDEVEVPVRLRPALALVASAGGSEAAVSALRERLAAAMEGASEWTVFDARERVGAVEAFTPEGLRRLYPLSYPDAGVGDWGALQKAARSAPGKILAVFDLGAPDRLWLLPAAPAPPLPELWEVSETALARLAEALGSLRAPVAQVGALLVDVGGVRVLTVEPGGPAAAAGLVAGDRILSAGGRPLATVAELRASWLPGRTVPLEVQGRTGRRSVDLVPEAVWSLPVPNRPGQVRSALFLAPPAEAPDWLAPWWRALALLDAGRWEEAAPALAAVSAPAGWASTLAYQRASTLLAAATGGQGEAQRLLDGVAADPRARAGAPDDLPLAPLARLRLAALRGE